jgi:hypothetical protein
MDANWQTERCSCCRVGDAPSTDLPSPFLSPFIRFFDHPHLLSLAAIVATWKWWNTSRSHPTSTPLHDTFYVMISVTFECEGQADLFSFFSFCRLKFLGLGLQQPISKLIKMKMVICNTSHSHPTSFWQVLRAFPFAGCCCWGWVYNNQYQNEYQMVM